jgi:hypothetical protein
LRYCRQSFAVVASTGLRRARAVGLMSDQYISRLHILSIVFFASVLPSE